MTNATNKEFWEGYTVGCQIIRDTLSKTNIMTSTVGV